MKRCFLPAFFWVFNFGLLSAQVWEHLPSPEGGGIVNFATDDSALYALTRAGIYRSEDEGYHWQLLKKSLAKTRNLNQLKVSKGVFYAFSTDGKLLRSTDEGSTWQAMLQKPFPIDHQDEKLKTLFVKGDTVLVGSTFTIYRSVDSGETWQSTVQLANELHGELKSMTEFKNEIFAAEGRYVYRSADGGLTWETVLVNSTFNLFQLTTTDTYLFALYRHKLVRSTDGMRTWQEFQTDTISKHDYTSKFKWLTGWGNELFYFFNHNGCPFYYCRSHDGGETWHLDFSERTERRLKDQLQDGVLFGQHFVAAGDGIFHSLDSAKTFTVAQEGMPILNIDKVVRQGKELVINTWNSTYLSEDEGETWLESPKKRSEWECSTQWQLMSSQSTLVLYGKTHFEEEIDCSNDQGRTWKTIQVDKNRRLATTDHAVWVALHDKVWAQDGYDYTYHLGRMQKGDSGFVFKTVIDFQPVDGMGPIYGFKDQLVIYDSRQYIVFNEDADFIRVFPSSPCDSLFGTFPQLQFDGTTYYTICGFRAYILQPNASEWQEIYPQDWTTGIPLYHSPMTFFKNHKGVTWIGLEGKGLFYATDDSGRFYPVTPQLPYPYPTDIAFGEDMIWVSTDGGGVYSLPLSNIQPENAPKPNFQLYPNPSSGAFQLHSDLFLSEAPQVELLDAAGRLIVATILIPGQFWDLDFPGLPKGLYFLKLKTTAGVVGLKWMVN